MLLLSKEGCVTTVENHDIERRLYSKRQNRKKDQILS